MRKIGKHVVFVLAVLVVGVTIWVGYIFYSKATDIEINPNASTYTEPIESRFEVEIITKVEKRIEEDLSMQPAEFESYDVDSNSDWEANYEEEASTEAQNDLQGDLEEEGLEEEPGGGGEYETEESTEGDEGAEEGEEENVGDDSNEGGDESDTEEGGYGGENGGDDNDEVSTSE